MNRPPLLIHPGSIPVSASRFVRIWGHGHDCEAQTRVTCSSPCACAPGAGSQCHLAWVSTPAQLCARSSLKANIWPKFYDVCQLEKGGRNFYIGTPSLDKTQLTMGYFDTDYLKCHSFHQIIDQTWFKILFGETWKYSIFSIFQLIVVNLWWWWRDEKVSHYMMRWVWAGSFQIQTCCQLIHFEEDRVCDPHLW